MLGRGLPAAAPGYALLLQHVAHQPGDGIPPHIHPGAEILYVETGTYGYTDFQGDAFVIRGAGATPTAGYANATPPAAELSARPLQEGRGPPEPAAPGPPRLPPASSGGR